MTPTPTPRPWTAHTNDPDNAIVLASTGEKLATVHHWRRRGGLRHLNGIDIAEQAANAALIVKAVNAHERLIEALRNMLNARGTGNHHRCSAEARVLLAEIER